MKETNDDGSLSAAISKKMLAAAKAIGKKKAEKADLQSEVRKVDAAIKAEIDQVVKSCGVSRNAFKAALAHYELDEEKRAVEQRDLKVCLAGLGVSQLGLFQHLEAPDAGGGEVKTDGDGDGDGNGKETYAEQQGRKAREEHEKIRQQSPAGRGRRSRKAGNGHPAEASAH